MSSIVLDIGESVQVSSAFWKSLNRKAYDRQSSKIPDGPWESIDQPSLVSSRLLFSENNQSSEKIHSMYEAEETQRRKKTCNTSRTFISTIEPVPPYLKDTIDLDGNCSDKPVEIALNLISEVWPEIIAEINANLSEMMWIESDAVRSYTKAKWFGAIFLNKNMLQPQNILELTTSIIHEVGHLALFSFVTFGNPFERSSEYIYSPFKKKDRPSIAVLHAQMALTRMIVWLHKTKDAGCLDKAGGILCDKWLIEFEHDFKSGFHILNECNVTDLGAKLLRDFGVINEALNQ